MSPTFLSRELSGDQLLASTRLPPQVINLVDDLASRTKRKRADVLRTIIIRHFVATQDIVLSDPRDGKL